MTVDEAREHAVDGGGKTHACTRSNGWVLSHIGSWTNEVMMGKVNQRSVMSSKDCDDGVGGPCARVQTVFYPLDPG